MSTIKENPNDRQTREAKTTRKGSIEKSKEKEYHEIKNRQPKRVAGAADDGAADEQPFDSKHNNMHQKR